MTSGRQANLPYVLCLLGFASDPTYWVTVAKTESLTGGSPSTLVLISSVSWNGPGLAGALNVTVALWALAAAALGATDRSPVEVDEAWTSKGEPERIRTSRE